MRRPTLGARVATKIAGCVGGVAQLGERRVRNAEVVSSILILSTNETSVLRNHVLHSAGQTWDTQMATIHKRTGASGAVSYQVKVRRTGHPALSRSFPTKALAEQWAGEYEAQIARGSMVDPAAARAVSMRALFHRYLSEVTPHKKGAAQERYVLLTLAGSKLAEFSPGTLTPAAVREWRDERLREVAPSTVNRGLAVLSHVIEQARKEWGIEMPANPVASVSRPRNARGRSRRLVGDEEARLLDACGGGRAGGAAYLHEVVTLAIETAMRRSELLSLRWEDIDLDRATARLHDSKNGEPRSVPLSQRARTLLRRMAPRCRGRPCVAQRYRQRRPIGLHSCNGTG